MSSLGSQPLPLPLSVPMIVGPHVDQGMLAGPLHAPIVEVLKTVLERSGLAAGHREEPSGTIL